MPFGCILGVYVPEVPLPLLPLLLFIAIYFFRHLTPQNPRSSPHQREPVLRPRRRPHPQPPLPNRSCNLPHPRLPQVLRVNSPGVLLPVGDAALPSYCLDQETLEPDMFRTTPLCMRQYNRLFGASRIPKLGCDEGRYRKRTARARDIASALSSSVSRSLPPLPLSQC